MKTIKNLREEYNLSRKELSDLTGIPVRTIQSWELGLRNAPAYTYNFIENVIKHPIIPLQEIAHVNPADIIDNNTLRNALSKPFADLTEKDKSVIDEAIVVTLIDESVRYDYSGLYGHVLRELLINSDIFTETAVEAFLNNEPATDILQKHHIAEAVETFDIAIRTITTKFDKETAKQLISPNFEFPSQYAHICDLSVEKTIYDDNKVLALFYNSFAKICAYNQENLYSAIGTFRMALYQNFIPAIPDSKLFSKATSSVNQIDALTNNFHDKQADFYNCLGEYLLNTHTITKTEDTQEMEI